MSYCSVNSPFCRQIDISPMPQVTQADKSQLSILSLCRDYARYQSEVVNMFNYLTHIIKPDDAIQSRSKILQFERENRILNMFSSLFSLVERLHLASSPNKTISSAYFKRIRESSTSSQTPEEPNDECYL